MIKHESDMIRDMIIPSHVNPMPALKIEGKQSSHGSNYEDSTMADLDKNDFSISITLAKIVTPEPAGGGSYLSYFAPVASNQYVLFTIETKSKLPMYDSPNKLHTVQRRFSDFEYLLNQLRER